ncbi:MAG: hypothetical protein KDB63_00715 [Nocardioidaceae bacterium]|nr:hypothetical protein [Nocardioidaceae bacterium]
MGAVVALAAGVVSTPAQADASTAATTEISGTLLVSTPEDESTPAFAVQTYEGPLVEIAGRGLSEADAGKGFRGTVAIPDSLGAVQGTAALRKAEVVHARLTVTRGTVSTAPALGPDGMAKKVKGTVHKWYVAAPGNLGDQGMTDADLKRQIKAVAAYWKSQANRRISKIVVPKKIVRYTVAATTTEAGCGLAGNDFWPTVQEAAARFPKANFGGADQLIVLMPASCAGEGLTGRAGMGSLSFAHGGFSILRTDARWFQQSLAHELGHNYGLDHSRLGPCDPDCTSDYGDLYSVMGGAVTGYSKPTALSSAYRVMQGITTRGEIKTLTFPTKTTEYTVVLRGRGDAKGTRGLIVPASSDGSGQIFLDFRSGRGVDDGTFYASAAGSAKYQRGLVAEVINNTNGIALLPDNGTKATSQGQSRYLAGGKVTVTVTAQTTTTITLKVTMRGVSSAWPSPGKVQLSTAPTVGKPVSAVVSGFSPLPDHLTYEWRLDGAAVPGATGDTYTPTGDIVGRQLAVYVTATNARYDPVMINTAQAQIAAGTITPAMPQITGNPAVGQTLTANPGAWTEGTTFTYLWYADGKEIAGQTGPTLTLTASEKGRKIWVTAIGSIPGYTTATKTSAPTGKVT